MIFCAFALAANYVSSNMYGSIRASYSPVVQLLLILSNGAVLAWLFVLDEHETLEYSLIGLGLAWFFSVTAMCKFNATFETINRDLTTAERATTAYYAAHILINAGMGFVSTWSLCTGFNYSAAILDMRTSLDTDEIVYIFIAALFLYSFVFFILDIVYFKVRTSHVYSPYLMCLLTAAAILWEIIDLDLDSLPTILTAVAIGLVWLMLFIKSIIVCFRLTKARLEENRKYNENEADRSFEMNEDSFKMADSKQNGSSDVLSTYL